MGKSTYGNLGAPHGDGDVDNDDDDDLDLPVIQKDLHHKESSRPRILGLSIRRCFSNWGWGRINIIADGKGLASLTQLVKVRRGNLVLALPSI